MHTYTFTIRFVNGANHVEVYGVSANLERLSNISELDILQSCN